MNDSSAQCIRHTAYGVIKAVRRLTGQLSLELKYCTCILVRSRSRESDTAKNKNSFFYFMLGNVVLVGRFRPDAAVS